MKKILITALATIVLCSGFYLFEDTMAEDVQTIPAKECAEGLPDFAKIQEDIERKIEEDGWNLSSHDDAYDDAREKYHKYVECIFGYTEGQILDNVSINKGTIQAHISQIDWMIPDAACMDRDRLNEIINNTAPNEMLTPLLAISHEYEIHLDKLLEYYRTYGEEKDNDGNELTGFKKLDAEMEIHGGIKRRIETEKENAIVAMDMAFVSIKELRTAFVMHVHFQCMIKNLEKYRTLLEDIRVIIEGFPTKLEDASMICK